MKTLSCFKSGRSLTLQTAVYSDKHQQVSLMVNTIQHEYDTSLENTVDVNQGISLISKKKCNFKNSKHERLLKRHSYCGYLALYIIAVISVFIASIMWTTDFYERGIYKTLVLSETSVNNKFWKNPTWQPLLSIYIFNYTNPEAVSNGNEKPNVQEIGPFVFREKSKKVNVKFHLNGTVSYQVYRNYTFIPELSVASDLNDTVITPNIIVFKAAAMMKGRNNFVKSVFRSSMYYMKIPIFNKMVVNDLIFGYEDELTKFGSKIRSVFGEKIPSKFGLLSKRLGLSEDKIMMYTGKYNMELYGIYYQINGMNSLSKWNADECDRISGTDGTIYPPSLVARKQPLSVFSDGSCRTITLYYDKEITSHGLPAFRYNLDPNMFQHSRNSCFCLNEECPVNGSQSIAPCCYGTPIYITYPHFMMSNQELVNGVTGINANFNRHTNYFDIHQNLGVLMSGKTGIQMNIMAQNIESVTTLSGIKEKTLLPLAWVELDLTSPPEDMLQIIFYSTYAIKFTKIFLKYGSVIISAICTYYIINRHKQYMRETLETL